MLHLECLIVLVFYRINILIIFTILIVILRQWNFVMLFLMLSFFVFFNILLCIRLVFWRRLFLISSFIWFIQLILISFLKMLLGFWTRFVIFWCILFLLMLILLWIRLLVIVSLREIFPTSTLPLTWLVIVILVSPDSLFLFWESIIKKCLVAFFIFFILTLVTFLGLSRWRLNLIFLTELFMLGISRCALICDEIGKWMVLPF